MTAAEVEVKSLAIDIALRSLRLSEPGGVQSLSDLRSIRDMLGDLEIMIVHLLREDGTTWEEIAVTLGVARQTAHYRLSTKTTQFVNATHDNHERPGYRRSLALRYRDNVGILRQLVDELSHRQIASSMHSRGGYQP